MPKWPPIKSTVAWNEENLNTYDAGTNTLTASGVLNLSSTSTLNQITMQGFDAQQSSLSFTVQTKGSGNADTYQLQGSYDKTTWYNADNVISITQALVGTPQATKSWNGSNLAGFPYYRINVTLAAGTTSTVVQWAYQLTPGGF